MLMMSMLLPAVPDGPRLLPAGIGRCSLLPSQALETFNLLVLQTYVGEKTFLNKNNFCICIFSNAFWKWNCFTIILQRGSHLIFFQFVFLQILANFITRSNSDQKANNHLIPKKPLRYRESIEAYWKSIKTYRVHYAQLVLGRRTDRSIYYVCIALYNSIATYSTVKYISSQSLTTTYILHSPSKQGLVT